MRTPAWRAIVRLGVFAAATVLPFVLAPASAQPRFDFDATPGPLPKTVVPSRYVLRFDLDPAREVFGGHAEIDLRVRQPVDAIVLHAHELTAWVATLVAADGGQHRMIVDKGDIAQSWRVLPEPPARIAPGEYTLRIEYGGKVNTSGQGLYGVPSSGGGAAERMLATQLEAVYARRLFPAFDEPAFRASFHISVRAPAAYEVLGNMPVQRVDTDGEARIHHLAPTPPMPSYLVALSVGRFDRLEGSAEGVPLRIFTAPGKREFARYAMQVTRQVVPFYSGYFGTPYALPKLDQLAVPGVRNGAMEDWGLISYTEAGLLFDPARSSANTERGIYSIVAHEIAHQWFGNLVTAASWDEIWLNEAFATWMANKTTHKFNPAWQWELGKRPWLDRVMTRDATAATRAIRSGPVRESAVFDVFDGITYTKGGAVLSMLEQWIGEETFRRGLADYMRERRLSNATAGDLWHHIGQASGRDIAGVAATWTDQPGFPLLHARSRCDRGRTRLALAQQRFRLGGAMPPGDATAQWKIPIRVQRGTTRADLLLDSPRREVELPGCTREPVVVNAGGAGFFRVDYAAADRPRLVRGFVRLAAADRVTLLSDTFALAQSGRLAFSAYFDLLGALPAVGDESRSALFRAAIDGLEFLDLALAGTPAHPRLLSAGRRLLGPALARVGWSPAPGEDPEVTQLRAALIIALARFDDRGAKREARRRFDADARTPLPGSIRDAVTQAVAHDADAARYDQLRRRLQEATSEEERWSYAEALAGVRDARLAERFLGSSVDGTLPPNIASEIPAMIARRGRHAAAAYRFTLTNWERLAAVSGGMFGAREHLLPEAAVGFNDRARAQALLADQRAKAGADGDASAAKVAEGIELAARVRQRDAAALAAYLSAWRPRWSTARRGPESVTTR